LGFLGIIGASEVTVAGFRDRDRDILAVDLDGEQGLFAFGSRVVLIPFESLRVIGSGLFGRIFHRIGRIGRIGDRIGTCGLVLFLVIRLGLGRLRRDKRFDLVGGFGGGQGWRGGIGGRGGCGFGHSVHSYC